ISNPILGGDDEKNMTKPDDISAVNESSKNLSKYFVRGKNMDQTEKIDNDIPTQTSISEINKDDILDISIKPNASEAMPQNVTPHLIQPDNNNGASAKAHISSLIESHSQIPIGGIGAIPVIASSLMSPLSAYIFLT